MTGLPRRSSKLLVGFGLGARLRPMGYAVAVFVLNCVSNEDWWRRRESNPRPKIFHTDLYMLIPIFKLRLFQSPSGGMLIRLVREAFAAVLTDSSQRLSCESTSNPALQEGTGRTVASFTRLRRIDNRQRLYLRSHRFYEPMRTRHATRASLSPSKPFRPHF
jgi:hypothetical protein